MKIPGESDLFLKVNVQVSNTKPESDFKYLHSKTKKIQMECHNGNLVWMT